MSSKFNCVWFSLFPDISFRTKVLLLEFFGSIDEVYFADEKSILCVPGINKREAALFSVHNNEKVNNVIETCLRDGIDIVSLDDPLYPQSLHNLYYPPAVLYIKGRLPDTCDNPFISVIGTRKASPYGIKMGTKIAYEISKCGGIVVSGLTAGIDAAGAKGAIMAGGSCVGVLGTSHDLERGELARRVSENGAVISEYAPGTHLNKGHFRARNRISAGLSVGTVVIEAPEKSGTRLFVNEAVEQGKDIFAVPGNADSPNSAGIIDFLRDGAKPVFDGWDIMSEYQQSFSSVEKTDGYIYPENEEASSAYQGKKINSLNNTNRANKTNIKEKQKAENKFDLKCHPELFTEEQFQVIKCLSDKKLTTDDIVFNSGLPAAKVLSILTILEIKRFVKRESGNMFKINNEYK